MRAQPRRRADRRGRAIDHEGDDDVDGADDVFNGGVVPVEECRLHLELDGYGYRWFRLHRAGRRMTP